MNVVIQELRRDHHNFHRVLKLIRHLVNLPADGVFSESNVGGRESMLRMAFDYMKIYVADVHHKKEDLVFDAFAAYSDFANVNLERMRDEHVVLNDQMSAVRDLAVSSSSAISSERERVLFLKQQSDLYFAAQVNHMQFEELSIYPPVETALTINDWKEIMRQSPKTDDPAFGTRPLPDFKLLADGVADLEKIELTFESKPR